MSTAQKNKKFVFHHEKIMDLLGDPTHAAQVLKMVVAQSEEPPYEMKSVGEYSSDYYVQHLLQDERITTAMIGEAIDAVPWWNFSSKSRMVKALADDSRIDTAGLSKALYILASNPLAFHYYRREGVEKLKVLQESLKNPRITGEMMDECLAKLQGAPTGKLFLSIPVSTIVDIFENEKRDRRTQNTATMLKAFKDTFASTMKGPRPTTKGPRVASKGFARTAQALAGHGRNRPLSADYHQSLASVCASVARGQGG